MPRKTKRKLNCLHLSTLINGRKYNSVSLEAVLPHSRATCYRRLQDPKQFTVEDLILLSDDGRMTIQEITEAFLKDGSR